MREHFWVGVSQERFDYVGRQTITRFKTRSKGFTRRNISSFKEERKLYR